jgi:hypothetical protein
MKGSFEKGLGVVFSLLYHKTAQNASPIFPSPLNRFIHPPKPFCEEGEDLFSKVW